MDKLLSEVVRDNINLALGSELGINARLAAYLGVEATCVSKWRRGKHVPSLNTIEKIAHFAHVPPAWLFRAPRPPRS